MMMNHFLIGYYPRDLQVIHTIKKHSEFMLVHPLMGYIYIYIYRIGYRANPRQGAAKTGDVGGFKRRP